MHQWNGRISGPINRAIDWLLAHLNESSGTKLRRRRAAVPVKNSGR